jgi:hypothetical protein
LNFDFSIIENDLKIIQIGNWSPDFIYIYIYIYIYKDMKKKIRKETLSKLARVGFLIIDETLGPGLFFFFYLYIMSFYLSVD